MYKYTEPVFQDDRNPSNHISALRSGGCVVKKMHIFCKLIVNLYLTLFQKMSAPGGEVAERRSPCTPNGDVMAHSSDEEKERHEYLETNFKYP